MRPAWDARWHPFGKRACWHHVLTARSTTLVFSSRESRFLAFMFLSTFCIPFPWMACDSDAESNDKALCKQKLLAARPCDNKSLKVGHFPTRTRVFFRTHVTTCGGHLGDDRAKVATNDLQGPTRQAISWREDLQTSCIAKHGAGPVCVCQLFAQVPQVFQAQHQGNHTSMPHASDSKQHMSRVSLSTEP